VIETFADKESQKIFAGEFSKKFPRDIQDRARRRLVLLHAVAKVPEDFWALPATKVKAMGNGWSIRINDQWRITFLWNAELQKATQVQIVDYH
jgi:toxin HigB-1